MIDLEKRKLRQKRYRNRKKAQGYQYIQLWVKIGEQEAELLKIALSEATISRIYDFIEKVLQDIPHVEKKNQK